MRVEIDPSRRLLEMCAVFGLRVERGAPDDPAARARESAASLDRALGSAEIALVTGASGSGKSSILKAMTDRMRARAERVIRPAASMPDRCVAELLPGDPTWALKRLALAGLGEAGLLARKPSELSEGQRARLSVARAISRAERGGGTVMIDEFCSTLDRVTAVNVASTTRRWIGACPSLRLVCASAHDDLLGALAPDVLVLVPPDGGPAPPVRRDARGRVDR